MESKPNQLLKEYESLLVAWNKTHNLFSKGQKPHLQDHIEESLAISSSMGDCVLDFGSGGGLPGIPLAITNPNKRFILVESNTKKAAFLLNAVGRLGLENTQVINKRIEEIELNELPECFDIVSRAVGSAETNIRFTRKLLKEKGVCLKLMKTEGQLDQENIPSGYTIKKIDKFTTKTKDKTRILVTIEKEQHNG